MKGLFFALLVILATNAALGQTSLHLKRLDPEWTGELRELKSPVKRRALFRSHLLLQYDRAPSVDQLRELQERGITVLGPIPDSGLSVSTDDATVMEDLGLKWYGRTEPSEKLSNHAAAAIAPDGTGFFVVEFHSDVDIHDAHAIVSQEGLIIVQNLDLISNHVLVFGSAEQLLSLAEWDEVSYIFPASTDLIERIPVQACAGAVTNQGLVGQSVASVGEGWDGSGRGAADLLYGFQSVTEKLAPEAARSEFARALAEWAKYAKLTFTPTTSLNGSRTLTVLFASGAHGDSYPFDGAGAVLAHTFFPYPVNPEPIAGDLHFDADENWKIGADIDLFSVALHEAGHALGLGHSDQPGAVMYPYYRKATSLTPDDIAAILTLYAEQDGTPAPAPPNPAPPSPPPAPTAIQIRLPVSTAAYTTTAVSVALAGVASDGSGLDHVSWTNSQGGSGTATGATSWATPGIPLKAGLNTISVTAYGRSGGEATARLNVICSKPAPAPDKTAPSITIVSPASGTVAVSDPSIVIRGTARDNVRVASVTWANSTGGSGVASGTDSWNTPAIRLLVGNNTITIRANDSSGNSSWRSVVVTRRR